MKILVAYFSHKGENYFGGRIIRIEKGNTEKVAEKIRSATGADIYEIRSASPYPETYKETVAAAVAELSGGVRPVLAGPMPDVKPYDAVVIAYPNWCGTVPMAVLTFLESADFSGKKIYPVCTHEGSGAGRSVSTIRGAAPGATVNEALEIVGSNADKCDLAVTEYLREHKISL